MLITEEESNARETSPKNAVNLVAQTQQGKFEIVPITHGVEKGSHRPNYTHEEKVFAAVVAESLGDKAAIEVTGVSQPSITNWKDGRIGRPSQERMVKHPELKEAIEDRLGIIRDKALDKLLESMGLIDDTKLNKLNGLQLSTVSSNLAGVVQKLTPQSNTAGGSTNIVIYAPNVKQVSDFKTVEV